MEENINSIFIKNYLTLGRTITVLGKYDEKKNTIFSKIKNFILNLFNKKQKEMEKEEYKFNKENDFKQRIIVEEDKEKTRLLNLQQEFEKGNIQEEDIDEADVEKLHKLYDEQIEEINKQTEMYKEKILKIKEKLNKSAD